LWPGEARSVQADTADAEQCHRFVDTVIEHYGRLDVLVNNAGWTARVDHRDLDGLTDEMFRKTFEINVFGTWWLTKAAVPHLKPSDDGNGAHHWRQIRRGDASPLAHAMLDLLEVWDFAQDLDHDPDAYEPQEEEE
jgi:NAD(P)-dependent dehydrogenase (short-subunit alcohol dehydrogenase family)